jgi:hypothetical protein
MAWDDIDNDAKPAGADKHDGPLIDDVKVQRVLNGGTARCNPAERAEVIERWQGPLRNLELATGWNVHRDLKRKAA